MRRPSLLDRMRDQPRRLQRLTVLIVVAGMGGVLLFPLVREAADPLPAEHPVPAVPDGSRPVLALPVAPAPEDPRVRLGRRLFFERGLSPREISCADCHTPAGYGTLPVPVSPDLSGGGPAWNVPTVLNAALNPFLHWDGSVRGLDAQLDRVLNDPHHMASGWKHVLGWLASRDRYRRRFERVYGALSRDAVTDALVRYQESLVTPGSPFDRYLLGDREALDADQLEGYRKFRRFGCIACHQGRNLGGNLVARFGLFGNPVRDGVFGEDRDDAEARWPALLRVPPLRNVARTGPYLHDGSVERLERVVRLMARYQLGQRLGDEDVRQIVRFLESLTAPLPPHFSPEPGR